MAADTQSHSEAIPDPNPRQNPDGTIYETCPGKSVFLEAGNTDGWISSDITVDVIR